jgi:hypothetical protein
LDRYDRELRRPFPSEPQLAPESNVWRRERSAADAARPADSSRDKARPAAACATEALDV